MIHSFQVCGCHFEVTIRDSAPMWYLFKCSCLQSSSFFTICTHGISISGRLSTVKWFSCIGGQQSPDYLFHLHEQQCHKLCCWLFKHGNYQLQTRGSVARSECHQIPIIQSFAPVKLNTVHLLHASYRQQPQTCGHLPAPACRYVVNVSNLPKKHPLPFATVCRFLQPSFSAFVFLVSQFVRREVMRNSEGSHLVCHP